MRRWVLAACAAGALLASPAALAESLIYSPAPGSASAATTILTRASTTQAILTGTLTDVSWDTKVRDDVGSWSSGASITAPAGYSRMIVTAYALWENNNNGGQRTVWVDDNGTVIDEEANYPSLESGTHLVTRILPVTAGHTIKIRVYQDSSATLQLYGPGNFYGGASYVQIEWLP